MDGEYGLHSQFGMIGRKRAEQRVATRKRQGYDFTRDDWHCSFNLADAKGSFSIKGTENCDAKKTDEGWLLETPLGRFKLVEGGADYVSSLLEDHEDEASWLNRVLELTIILIFASLPILYFLTPEKERNSTKMR